MNNDQHNKEVIGYAFGHAVNELKRFLRASGQMMKQDAEKTLNSRNGYSSGEIVKTIKSTVTETRIGMVLEFGCYAKSETGYPYPSVVEFGRRPGEKPPPSSVVERWLYDKGRTGHIYTRDLSLLNKKRRSTNIKRQLKAQSVMVTQDTRGLAYVIARSIGEHGIKEKPFMRPAFAKGVEWLTTQIKG